LLFTSSPHQRVMCAQGGEKLFMKLWLFCLWFYWLLIKQLSDEPIVRSTIGTDRKVRACPVYVCLPVLTSPPPWSASKKPHLLQELGG
jgi:hypothetical protein